jgi:hypothetical protein
MEKQVPTDATEDHGRDALDQRHESDRRGEHRYPDTHQRPAERQAREQRDDLKDKLKGRTRNR